MPADTSLFFALPEKPDSFNLTINEVMFNPVPSGCDYVEFVNRSEKCIDLSNVWITNRDENGMLNEGCRLSEKSLPCLPGSYWLLSENPDSVCLQNICGKACNRLNLSWMPSMPDDEGNIALLTTSAEVIDEMSYDESMHFVLINDKEGVSLEKFNPDRPSDVQDSWCSASATSGYGTPGYVNSQYKVQKDEKVDIASCDNKWLSPDNDGLDDAVCVNIFPPKPGMISLRLFDLRGRLVRTLLKNKYVGSNDQVIWDGTADSGSLVPFGRYILHVEYFSQDGICISKRFVLSVLL
jgi:hypothetical protein